MEYKKKISSINSTIHRSTGFNGFVFSMACPGRLNPWDMLTVTQHSSFSDWIFLYYLAKNMEPYLFREMLIELANELRNDTIEDDYDEGSNEMTRLNVGISSEDDNDDTDDEGHDKMHDSAIENDKNNEVNKVLLTSEKNK